MKDFLKSLNPSQEDNVDLVYGNEYKLWRNGVLKGIAVWTQDENVGDSFQTSEMGENGIEIKKVWIADKWELNENN